MNDSIMCEYNEIEQIRLSNGKTVKEANLDAHREIERIYMESWAKGVSVPFWDDKGNIFLANPDGSEDKVSLDTKTRTYRIITRTAQAGQGRYAYLL